jgi:hypothetical protein
LGAVLFAVVAAATLAFAWRLRDGVAAAALACCAAPFVLPFFHEHDLVVILLPALICATRLRGGWLAVASAGTVAASVDWIGLAQRPSGLAQTVAMAFAVALAFGVIASAPARARLTGLLVPFGVAAIGFVAAAHGAPVWPDALPPHFAAPADASAAGVWSLEQRAAGLERPDPLWATLRLASLAGCAMLWCSLAAQVGSGAPTALGAPEPAAPRFALGARG